MIQLKDEEKDGGMKMKKDCRVKLLCQSRCQKMSCMTLQHANSHILMRYYGKMSNMCYIFVAI